MSEIQIDEYRVEDKSKCIDLLERSFHGSSNDKTFAWRFESDSRLSPLMVCAKDGDRVISFTSWIGWDFHHNKDHYIGYQAGEAATDERYRNRGVWSAVLNYADNLARTRKIDFLFSFPGNMSYSYKAFCRAGYCPIGTLNFYLRIVNPFTKPMNNYTVHKFSDFSSPFLSEKNKIIPVIDSSYVDWRYIENPKKYDIINFTKDANHASFMVLRNRYYNKKYNVSLNEVILLDCQFSSLNAVFVKNAFRYLDSIYARNVIYMRTFFNPRTARGEALTKNFHFRIGSRYEILFVKRINKAIDYNIFFDINNWDIMPHVIDES